MGKDLAIAVAKEVMGWAEWDTKDDYDGSFPMFCDWGESKWLTLHKSHEDWSCWSPWRDMNDAWEVVAKIASSRFSVRMRFIAALREMIAEAEDTRDFDLVRRVHLAWWFFFYSDPCEVILQAALEAVRGET